MKVVTLNTWQERGPWQKRWEIICSELHRISPDVVCFQEIFNESWALSLREKLGLPFAHYPIAESGLLTLARTPLSQNSFFCYQSKGQFESYARFLSYTFLCRGNAQLAILNTHLSWVPEDHEARRGQIEEIQRFANSFACPVLLMGDFNAAAESYEIQSLIKDGWVDLFAVSFPGYTGYTWTNSNPYAASASHHLPDRRIDFFFLKRAKCSLKNLTHCSIILDTPSAEGVYPSDHFGLLLDIPEEQLLGVL